MLLKPYSIKKINESSTNTLSPKGLKKPTYIRLKGNKQKNTKSGRSLCSIETYRQSSSLTNRRMLSHRKLISVSSLQHRQNLTDRKEPLESQKQNKFTTLQSQRIHHKQVKSGQEVKQYSLPRPHLNKFTQRNDRLYTIQNQDITEENILEIKENILKQFIDRFQQQLREISQKKSNTIVPKGLSTNRRLQNSSKEGLIKQKTTKKPRLNNIIAAASLQSNRSTVNLGDCVKQNKQNIPSHQEEGLQKSKFQQYIRSLKDHKKKDQKILIMKNHKRSLQSISLSRIGDTQSLLTNRLNNKIESKLFGNNNRMNLKQLFKHSKKYEPYLRQSSTLNLSKNIAQKVGQVIQEKQSKLERSSEFIESPTLIKKQGQQIKQIPGLPDCSSIENMNQSSFISEVGRKSLLKHLQRQSIKLTKQENKKSKKCLTKMKSIFPVNFF